MFPCRTASPRIWWLCLQAWARRALLTRVLTGQLPLCGGRARASLMGERRATPHVLPHPHSIRAASICSKGLRVNVSHACAPESTDLYCIFSTSCSGDRLLERFQLILRPGKRICYCVTTTTTAAATASTTTVPIVSLAISYGSSSRASTATGTFPTSGWQLSAPGPKAQYSYVGDAPLMKIWMWLQKVLG